MGVAARVALDRGFFTPIVRRCPGLAPAVLLAGWCRLGGIGPNCRRDLKPQMIGLVFAATLTMEGKSHLIRAKLDKDWKQTVLTNWGELTPHPRTHKRLA